MLTLEKRFLWLKRIWKSETGFMSSITDMSNHPAYQIIIAMGYDVVPLILRDLQEKPEHWFVALTEITGEDPIKQEHAGYMRKMANDWIEWGKSRGFC